MKVESILNNVFVSARAALLRGVSSKESIVVGDPTQKVNNEGYINEALCL
jgi:hypothetical protein